MSEPEAAPGEDKARKDPRGNNHNSLNGRAAASGRTVVPLSGKVPQHLAHLRAKIAVRVRYGQPADDLKRELRAATLAEHIRRVVDEAPPLSAEQRAELAAILAPTGGAA